jgi:hypothetical protein
MTTKRAPKDRSMLDKKYEDLLEAYQRAIERRGEDARFVAKELLYQEAGEAVHLTAVYAGRIIRKKIRESALGSRND